MVIKCRGVEDLIKVADSIGTEYFRTRDIDSTDIYCYNVENTKMVKIFEEARAFSNSYQEITVAGNLGLWGGLAGVFFAHFGGLIGSARSIFDVNVKLRRLCKNYDFIEGSFRYAVVQLYLAGFRICSEEMGLVILRATGEYLRATIPNISF